jgi:hypothetical protein
MLLKSSMRLTVMATGVFAVALVSVCPRPATARDSYSWCTQGSLLHCYYTTREQCEMTVDYHGFCVPNPDMSPPNN